METGATQAQKHLEQERAMMRSEVDSVERRLNQAEKTRDAAEKRTKQLEEELGQKMACELSLGQAVKAAAEADMVLGAQRLGGSEFGTFL